MDEQAPEHNLPANMPQSGYAPVSYVPPQYAPTPVLAAVPTAADLPTLDFQGIFSVLARRKWLILTLLAFWIGLAILYLKHSPKVYESTGKLEVESSDSKVGPFDEIRKDDMRSIDALKTVEQNLLSTTLIQRMITNQNLGENLRGSMAAMIHQVQQKSSVALERGTRVLSISYRDTNPDFAKRVVDAYIQEYGAHELEQKKRIEQASKEQLEKNVSVLQKQLEEKQSALEDFQRQHADLALGSGTSRVDDRLADLDTRVSDARARRIDLEAALRALGTRPNLSTEQILRVSAIAQSQDIVEVRQEVRRAQTAFEQLKKEFLSKHPAYKRAEAEIVASQARLSEALKSALDSLARDLQNAQATETDLVAELAKQKSVAYQRDDVSSTYVKLKSDVEEFQSVLTEVQARFHQTEVNLKLETPFFSVQQEPMVSEFPIWPSPLFILAGGLLLGLTSGLGLAFALELLRRKVRDGRDVEKLFPTAASLAELPSVRLKKTGPLVITSDPHSAAAEAFRGLRTALYFQGQGDPKVILFTSANTGEGKSYTALNCAAAYALQGKQTLLIDGDLRRPSLEPELLKGHNRGMSDFLRGRVEPHEVCYPTEVKGLYFIPSGELRSNPAELLSGPYLAELLEKGGQFFDKIIIDSAPLVPVSDALMLARYADAICLVVRTGTTKRQELSQVRDILAKTHLPLAGYVLNGVTGGDVGSSYINYMSHMHRGSKARTKDQQALPMKANQLGGQAAIL